MQLYVGKRSCAGIWPCLIVRPMRRTIKSETRTPNLKTAVRADGVALGPFRDSGLLRNSSFGFRNFPCHGLGLGLGDNGKANVEPGEVEGAGDAEGEDPNSGAIVGDGDGLGLGVGLGVGVGVGKGGIMFSQ